MDNNNEVLTKVIVRSDDGKAWFSQGEASSDGTVTATRPYVIDIDNQGQIGSSVGQSVANALEYVRAAGQRPMHSIEPVCIGGTMIAEQEAEPPKRKTPKPPLPPRDPEYMKRRHKMLKGKR